MGVAPGVWSVAARSGVWPVAAGSGVWPVAAGSGVWPVAARSGVCPVAACEVEVARSGVWPVVACEVDVACSTGSEAVPQAKSASNHAPITITRILIFMGASLLFVRIGDWAAVETAVQVTELVLLFRRGVQEQHLVDRVFGP